MLTLYLIVGVIILGGLLIGLVFGLTALYKRKIAAYFQIILMMQGLLILIVLSYVLVHFAVVWKGLGDNELWIKLMGLPQGFEDNIWFNLGSFEVNYSIARSGIRTFSIIGGALGVIRGLIGVIQKLIKRRKEKSAI